MVDPVQEAETPVVVLGGGYAGLTVAHEVHRRGKGQVPVVLIDRHPVHVLRTELYEVGELAGAQGDVRKWTVPLAKVFERTSVKCREGTVLSIDLDAKVVTLDTGRQPYRALAICLGSVAAYYHVPGAAEHTESVYRLGGAQRLAARLAEVERASEKLAGERRPRVIVVGGGSTGTELAAEIATTDWSQIVGGPARAPEVVLVTGSLPFLAGLPPKLVAHADRLLGEARVAVIRGYNVQSVAPGRLHLEDGTVLANDLVVWCAGREAPPLVRELPVPHGKGGRIAVAPTLEIPGHAGVFAVGDVIEYRDPETGLLVPGTAQAALSEARTAGQNLVAFAQRSAMVPFHYKERGVIVAVGRNTGAGSVRHVTIWGSPAALLKRLVQADYAKGTAEGGGSRLL